MVFFPFSFQLILLRYADFPQQVREKKQSRVVLIAGNCGAVCLKRPHRRSQPIKEDWFKRCE